ncbi:multidrug effflux MFS transporter [Streptomyces roseus]|uniref:multidrug effflux MFS transporter n=1 Tax=Streptomyces roseus TaxID=66430 RepID=UPI0007C66474|nr:multidrug effflux MFS transporter [Streptomyces roseus]
MSNDASGRQTRFIVLLSALVALGPLSIDGYLPGLPALAGDLRASAAATQLTITACLAGLAIGQLIAGPLSDTYGRRRPLLAGLALYAIASALCAVAPDVRTLIGLRLVQGIGGAFGIVIANAMVRDRTSGTRTARLYSTLTLVTGLAPVFAPVLGGQLLRLMAWPGIFAGLAVLGAVMLAASAAGLPQTRSSASRQPLPAVIGQLLSDRIFTGYVLANALVFAAMFAYISGSPFVLQEIHGLSPQQYSAVFAVNAAGLIAAAQTSGRLVARTGARVLLLAGLLGATAAGTTVLGAVLTRAPLPVLLIGLFVLVSSVGLVMPNAAAQALADHGQHAGSAAALHGFSQFMIGGALAPLAGAGGATDALPRGIIVAVLPALALLTLGVLTRSIPREPTHRPARQGRAAYRRQRRHIERRRAGIQ